MSAAAALQSVEDSEPEGSSGPSLSAAIGALQLDLSQRYRLESVHDDRKAPGGDDLDKALASTLRTELAVRTGNWKGFTLQLAAEDVTVLGGETFNNAGAGGLANGRTDRAVIADADNTEISQAYLQFQSSTDDTPRFSARLGRQEINLGRQRFLGAVGWRQNHQEFDALTITLNPTEKLVLQTGWLDRVHTVTGANLDMDSAYARAGLRLDSLDLTAYGTWLDYARDSIASLSTQTLGVRGQYTWPAGWRAAAEFARQTDHQANPLDYSLDYTAAELGWKTGQLSWVLGTERLEGNGELAFRTPLATLHKFNGFADQFLATPPDGLEDLFLQAAGRLAKLDWTLRFHRFGATESSLDYGDEWDSTVAFRGQNDWIVAFKAAVFSGRDGRDDVVKVMVWASWKVSAPALQGR